MESGIDLITKDASNAKLSNKIDWGNQAYMGRASSFGSNQ